ncbi:hypothetical protein [Streptosporangium sp. NPDC006930]|uniref:hypothetical protein n=1 Tax=Streptosporangium sp. NPDC006930 TaxID=3154783 RepID=UPI00342D646B
MRLAIRIGVATTLMAAPSTPAEPVVPPTPTPAARPVAPPIPAPTTRVDVKALPTPVVTANAAPTPAPVPTNSVKAVPTPAATAGAKAAPTPTPTLTPTPLATATPSATASATATVNATSTATATATIKSKTKSTVWLPPFGGRNTIPPWLKKVPSLRVVPTWPRQASSVRIFVHCPPNSNHAIIGSGAFNLKGSRRIYREVGLGLSNRGLGHRAASISRFVLPGYHGACLTCVKVTMNKQTGIRRIKVLGRASAPLYVRRFSIWQFFNASTTCVKRDRC